MEYSDEKIPFANEDWVRPAERRQRGGERRDGLGLGRTVELILSFVAGIALTLLVLYSPFSPLSSSPVAPHPKSPHPLFHAPGPNDALAHALGPAHKPEQGLAPLALAIPSIGLTTSHIYPPPSPTNVPSSPSSSCSCSSPAGGGDIFKTDVGYAGPTPTAAEPGLIKTAPGMVVPSLIPGGGALVAPPSFGVRER